MSKIFILLAFTSFSSLASAQRLKNHSFGNYFNAFEVTPVFNGEKALITSPIGMSFATETEVEQNINFTSEFRYFTVSSGEIGRNEGLHLTGEDLTRQNMHSFSLIGGLRYYTHPKEHSWYGDGKIGLQRNSASYDGNSIDAHETSHSIPFIMELGHRFVLDQSYTLRFGARMSKQYVLSQQIRNNSSESNKKISDISYDIPSALNVSFGYHF